MESRRPSEPAVRVGVIAGLTAMALLYAHILRRHLKLIASAALIAAAAATGLTLSQL